MMKDGWMKWIMNDEGRRDGTDEPLNDLNE